MPEKELKIPDLEICKQYLPEAEKIDDMPEEETDLITLNFEPDTYHGLELLAESWQVTVERVMQTLLIALVRENEKSL